MKKSKNSKIVFTRLLGEIRLHRNLCSGCVKIRLLFVVFSVMFGLLLGCSLLLGRFWRPRCFVRLGLFFRVFPFARSLSAASLLY